MNRIISSKITKKTKKNRNEYYILYRKKLRKKIRICSGTGSGSTILGSGSADPDPDPHRNPKHWKTPSLSFYYKPQTHTFIEHLLMHLLS